MIYVSSVNVSPSTVTLNKGQWYYGASATVYPVNATCQCVEWRSSNPTVASVNSEYGYIYANSAGTAVIYAKAADGSGAQDYMVVKVVENIPVTCVKLDKKQLTLKQDRSHRLTATVCPLNATKKALVWTSGNSNIATVTDGLVYAKSPGTTSVHAFSTDGTAIGASCSVTVIEKVLVDTVKVIPSSKAMAINEEACLYASVSPYGADNKTLRWSSSNSSVVEVDEYTGCIYANAVGSATVYATAQDGSGKRGSCVVTVSSSIPVTGVVVTPGCETIFVGNTKQLSATAYPIGATNPNVTWYSSDSGVASVNSTTGKVTARSVGTANVFAVSSENNNLRDYCCITVKAEPPKVTAKEDEYKNTTQESVAADPVDVYSGAHTLKNNLLTLFGGQGVSLTAHYDSRRLCDGSLGVGWYHNYEKHLQICDCEAYVYSSPSVYAKYTATTDSSVFNCTTAGKAGYVLTVNYADQYPYCLDCNSEKREYYNAAGRLAKIVDRHGFETAISYSGSVITVTDAVTGKSIYLEKDSSNKIVRVYDDAFRTAILTYIGDFLVDIRDVNGNSLKYSYDSNGRIKYGIDAQNIRYFENTYDSSGRVVSQRDGVGSAPTQFEYGDNGLRTITNRNGHKSIRVFNDRGLLESYTDENGNTKTYAYDDNGNITLETDALGNSVTKVYNKFNKPTEVTDKNGNTTYCTYDDKGNLTKITYPENGGATVEETYVYNGRNQVVSHTDLRGTVTVYTYDENGMPKSKKIGSKPAVSYTYRNGFLMSETDAKGTVTAFEYNHMCQLDNKTDCYYYRTSYEYDKLGNVLKITDPNCNSVRYTYDSNGQKKVEIDANGNEIEYTYNGNMKTDAVYLHDGGIIRYEYDGEDRVLRVTDQNGGVTVTEYDPAGRVTSKVGPDGGTVTYEYDAVGNVIKETNPLGAATTKTYDKNGNVLTVTDHNGNTVSYTYDKMSRVIKAVNAVSGTTAYTYSAAGDLISETDALGNVRSYTYDAYGNKLSFTDANGNTTFYTYDVNNNLETVTDPLGNTATNYYDHRNLLIKTVNAKGNCIEYRYDGVGKVISTIDARGNISYNNYDGVGNITSATDFKGNVVSTRAYDNMNRLSASSDAYGATTRYTYNKLGKVETVTDPLGNRQQYAYNSRGLNTAVTDALGNVSTAQYNALGEKTAVSGPIGGTVRYSYDDTGRLISESTMSGGAKKYTYNALNLKETLTNARGDVRQYSYDALGRITGYTDADDTVSYTYDKNGNVLTVTDKNGTITRTFDALNRVTSCTDTFGKTVKYFYDTVGNLIRLTYPDNTSVDYTYDENNNLKTVTDWACRRTEYTYDQNNKVTRVVKPDGSTTTTAYDKAQRVIYTTEYTRLGELVTGFEYRYDNLGRIITEINLAKNYQICYTYDKLSRVTQRRTINICECSEVIENFTYDAAGNISQAGNNKFTHDANNRLVAHNGIPVTYDRDGNMLSAKLEGTPTTFEYDSANRLIKAGENEYTYNAEDIRIRNLCDGTETTYTYNTNARLSQLLVKTTNGITTKYVYGLGLIGEEKCDVFKTYHFDFRGSTIAITNQSGYVTDTFEYDTYGRLTKHTGSSFVIFGYNGRDGVITDRNGLIYMRARYYSPELRRFINADIIPGEISNAITLNRYAYANGNPVSLVDPFGLSADERRLPIYYAGNNVYTSPKIFVGDNPWDYETWKLLNSSYPCKWRESGKQGPSCPITLADLAILGFCTTCGVEFCCDGIKQDITKISKGGLKFIAEYEKFYSKPYDDGYGNMTIGYGHLIRDGENFTEITEEQALELLREEVAVWEQAVIEYSNKLGVEWNQNEFDALVSLAFNSGNNFKYVIDDIVKGGDPYDEFDDIIKANGQKSLGLYRRRMDEADIFVNCEYDRQYREWP